MKRKLEEHQVAPTVTTHPNNDEATTPPGFSHRISSSTLDTRHGLPVICSSVPAKSLLEAYLLCIPLGFLGLHHFYLRRYGFGFLYLLTGGLCGVGWMVDVVRLPCLVQETNRKLAQPINDDFEEQVSLVDAYLLWFPLGILGLHHYYLRRPVWGVAYTFSAGFLCVGWLIDAFRLPSLVREANFRLQKRRTQQGEIFHRSVDLCDAYILCLIPPLGILGAHHFYMRRSVTGIFYFFTLGGCGFGWIIDLIRMKWLVDRINHPERYPLAHRQKFLDDAYVYAFPLGFLGLHHFYLERPLWGLLYFFTGGLCGVGWLVDLCRLPCLVRDTNQRLENELALLVSVLRSNAAQTDQPHIGHYTTFGEPRDHPNTSNGSAFFGVVSSCPGGSSSGSISISEVEQPPVLPPPPYEALHPQSRNCSSSSSVTAPALLEPSDNPPVYSPNDKRRPSN